MASSQISDIDLDKIIAQRAEARGDDGMTQSFQFAGQVWTFKDTLLLSDDDKDELAELHHDVDLAAWYMGDEQYDKFVTAGGNSSLFFLAFRQYMKDQRDDIEGKSSRPNRSSRRAASKKPKRP